MRLEVTRRSDLAIQALLALHAGPERAKAAALAEQVGTTKGFVTQVMNPLVQQGWVRSDPGPAGGYAAVFDPDEVSILAVIEAVEGPIDTGRCVLEDRACAEAGTCALHRPWSRARGHLIDDLGSQRLSSLIETGPS
ncbi:RrF2 family transcriptional regulator [Aquihabitans daechungensis]|uniref:RrF2 family transcriptional regulator n=1 Tax=Aquihabitans daechungensis TaxID=1052257 RepID=UPI003BA07785